MYAYFILKDDGDLILLVTFENKFLLILNGLIFLVNLKYKYSSIEAPYPTWFKHKLFQYSILKEQNLVVYQYVEIFLHIPLKS